MKSFGASPESEHARDCMKQALHLTAGNRVVGTFMCQGRVSSKTVEVLKHHLPEEERGMADLLEAERTAEDHPDEKDLENARKVF